MDKIVKGQLAAGWTNPMSLFDFELQDWLQCKQCNGVSYKKVKTNQLNLVLVGEDGKEPDSVKLEECLDRFFSTDICEIDCPKCAKKTFFEKKTRFLNFPKALVMSTQRETFADWVPKKVETKLVLGSEKGLNLE